MTIFPNFTIFLSLACLSLNFSLQIKQILEFSYEFYRYFVNNFIFLFLKLTISSACFPWL